MDAEVRDKFVADLRDFADFIEDRGAELPIDKYDCDLKLTSWVENDWDDEHGAVEGSAKAKLKQVVKVLGKARKEWSENYLDVRKEFGSITLEFTIGRSQVCERVHTGEVIKHEAQVIPAREEKVYEWVCDDKSLLA